MGFKANRLLGISSYSIHSSVKCAALVNINNYVYAVVAGRREQSNLKDKKTVGMTMISPL